MVAQHLSPLAPVFRNAHFVVVDKPAGWLSVPSRLGANDARPCVGKELEASLGIRLWPVHRLDLEVTGLLLFAATAAAHRQANAWFEQSSVAKRYEAWTDGQPPAAPLTEWEWECRLLRGKKRAFESPHGKPAQTLACFTGQTSYEDGEALMWRLAPRTGRPHQLRYEMSRHGFPILGDELYGSRRPCPGPKAREPHIALRCVALDFTACPGALELGLAPMLAATPLTEKLNATSNPP